jgi:hypothetical protein
VASGTASLTVTSWAGKMAGLSRRLMMTDSRSGASCGRARERGAEVKGKEEEGAEERAVRGELSMGTGYETLAR